MSSFSGQDSNAEVKPGRGRFERRPPVSTEKLFDRLPPHSLEAEMSLLGSILLEPRMLSDVLAIVRSPDEFYSEAHSAIYKAAIEVFDRFNSGDLVQIVESIKDKGQLELVGGSEYLIKLAESVPSAVNAPHYARIVSEKAKLRKLIDAAGTILYDSFHVGELGPDGAREVLDKAETMVFEIAQQHQIADPQLLKDLLQIEIDRIESQEGKGISGVPSGYPDLDEMLRGMQPGELIIIAARPSMGKTALALNIAEQMATGGASGGATGAAVPIALFSLEMSKSAVTQRLISARSGIPSQNLRGGVRLSDRDYRKLLSACDELAKAPIFVDDTPNMTVLALRARARRLVAQHGVKAIMIDYLQLLTAPGAARESRQVEVSTISRGIKALARELNVPVVCLSQLNRASEQREGNKPRMSDLRESGSIEQDADVIILLHREDYYHVQDENWKLDNPDKVGVAELIVAKQRNGPTGVVKLAWDSNTTRFQSYAGAMQPPPEFAGSSPFDAAPGGSDIGYSQPSEAASNFGQPRSAFAPGSKTGPISNHRDGGGPDRDEAPPFDANDGGEDGGTVGGVPY
ncbi:MAG TPA: replicative DNA helicase [Phycisphaerales bacterium]